MFDFSPPVAMVEGWGAAAAGAGGAVAAAGAVSGLAEEEGVLALARQGPELEE